MLVVDYVSTCFKKSQLVIVSYYIKFETMKTT